MDSADTSVRFSGRLKAAPSFHSAVRRMRPLQPRAGGQHRRSDQQRQHPPSSFAFSSAARTAPVFIFF